MTSVSDAVSGVTRVTPVGGKIEFQLRGPAGALTALRDILETAGVFVQADHEFRDTVWKDDGLVIGALMVPTLVAVETEGGAHA